MPSFTGETDRGSIARVAFRLPAGGRARTYVESSVVLDFLHACMHAAGLVGVNRDSPGSRACFSGPRPAGTARPPSKA